MAFALTTSMNEMIIAPFELSQRQDVLYAAPNTIALCTRSTLAKRIKKSHLSSLQASSVNQVNERVAGSQIKWNGWAACPRKQLTALQLQEQLL